MAVQPGASRAEPGLIVLPRGSFTAGACVVDVSVSDGAGFATSIRYKLLGPAGKERHDAH